MKAWPLYVMVLAIWLGWCGPEWAAEGMFMDGLWYATIARNLSIGIGQGWSLQFTETLGNPFVSHPPLAFWLQSSLFSLLGDTFWVERIYSLGSVLLAGILFWRTWILLPQSGSKRTGWLPLLLFVSMPLIPWTTAHNMLENTLLLTTGISCLGWAIYLHAQRKYGLILMGLGVVLGILTKGPPALFILSLPLWTGICLEELGWRKGLGLSVWLGLGVVATLGLLCVGEEPRAFGEAYLQTLWKGGLAVSTVSNRLFILGKWLGEIIVPLLLTGIIGWILRVKIREITIRALPLAFLLTSLSGVLPYLLTLKQRGFYLIPSLPFFALALALILAPALIRKWPEKTPVWTKGIAIGLLGIALMIHIVSAGKIGRNQKQIELAKALSQQVPAHTLLATCPKGWEDWSLHGYLYRYGYLSLQKPDTTSDWKLYGPNCYVDKKEEGQQIGDYMLFSPE